MQLIKRSFRPEQVRELSLIVLIALILLFFSSQIEVTSVRASLTVSPVM